MKSETEVNIEYSKTYIEKKKLYLEYELKVYEIDKRMHKAELERMFLNMIPKEDRRFFSVDKLDLKKKKIVFLFHSEKWLESKCKIVDTEDRFTKKVVLTRIPGIISANVNVIDVERYILLCFRTYLESNSKFRRRILVNDPVSSHYTFKFDGHINGINVSLKDAFRHSSIVLLRAKNGERKEVKKADFDASVYTYLNLKRRSHGKASRKKA